MTIVTMQPDFSTNLNSAQQQAVKFSAGDLLVLAGAGSGKTRVLVYRIAWLLSQGVPLQNILAVTFTNKAANEMRNRLEEMLQISLSAMWIGTFHGLAHRLLRLHWQEAGLAQSFQILDVDDQSRLIKRIHKTLSLDQEKYPAKRSQAFINNHKEQGRRSQQINAGDFNDPILVKVYQLYEEICERSSLVDFSELLLRSYELWQGKQLIREHYQKRFQYILVDEFQDTNAMQYDWIKLLTGAGAKLTAVGDDDQSIYGWRGANSANMLRLSKDYPGISIIKLEQNYRSTGNILQAANAVITNNSGRLGKELWTAGSKGEPLTIYAAFNETDEARYLVDKISWWMREGNDLNAVAILYRSNAQSRVIEEQLMRVGVSYRVYGGMRFYERAEIKDILSYLRLLVNRNDDTAFERVVNLPVRGIGEASLGMLRDYAKLHSCSLWQACQTMVVTKQLSARVSGALDGFMRLINDGAKEVPNLDLAPLVKFIIDLTGLRAHYTKAQYDEYQQSRLENLDELIIAAEQFSKLVYELERQELLNSFLAHTALEAGEHVNSADNGCVRLMTLHAAKGLEFPLVFLCGLEEGLFPHIMSMETRAELEEERRLCYVGMTRARQKLYLLHAASRRLYGKSNLRRPSRFLSEIPVELVTNDSLLNSVKPALFTSEMKFSDKIDKTDEFYIGQEIAHQYFGEGVITGFEGQGEGMLAWIKFKKFGNKLLSLQHPAIKII